MKISTDRLKQIIQEEMTIGVAVPADTGGMMGGVPPVPNKDGAGYMAKQNLWKIAEYAGELYKLVQDDDCLEPWVQEKLAIAAYIMDSIGHYIEYEAHRRHESAEGDIDTLEVEEEPEAVGAEEFDEEEYECDMDDDYDDYEEPEEDEYEDVDEDSTEVYDEGGKE
jgi:phosphopantothenoylcysteine synthetase/decarboxylase